MTNQEKVFYPATGTTKGDVVRYYHQVASFILPHLHDRPVSLVRFPDGVKGEHFYEKNAPRFAPDWITTHDVPRRRSSGKIRYILINDPATLVWCANLAAVELHPFLHRASDLERPTSVAFDLDPGEGADLLSCIEVAFRVKAVLDGIGLESFPKVTGSKGLQIFVPLNTKATYAQTGPFAKAVAELLEEEHPDLVVSRMAKTLRRGRVMIDWSQNNGSKTTVCAYSLRGKREAPFISMPVAWTEVRRIQRSGKVDALYFDPAAALARLKRRGDLFAPVLRLKQQFPKAFDFGGDGERHPRARSRKTRRTKSAGRALAAYESKRDFSKTAEPPAKGFRQTASIPEVPSGDGQPRFVIQKHAARNLHYDFRLEHEGTLKSWAVPKGLPYALNVKRSGFQTEDHPLDYLAFEGTIPKGQYGGGTVMVWDIGTYEVVSGDPDGRSLRFRLHGKKLRGEWKMYRIREDNGKAVWLIEKAERAMTPVSHRRDDSSVLTRRSMARIAEDNDAVWSSSA